METNTSAKYKKHHQYKKFLLFFILGLLIFTAIFYGVMIKYLIDQSIRIDNRRLGQTIIQADEALLNPVPVDAKSGSIYFYNQKLTLPPSPLSIGELNYYDSWSGQGDQQSDGINISRKRDVTQQQAKISFSDGDLNHMMEKVPKLQACSRGMYVSFKKVNYGTVYEGQKTLSNGKVVYFYSEKLCQNQEFTDYIKQINSY